MRTIPSLLIPVLVIPVSLALADAAQGQDLASAARKERERRAAAAPAKPAQSFGERDLEKYVSQRPEEERPAQTDEEPAGPAPESTAAGSPRNERIRSREPRRNPAEAGPGSGSGESYWRGRAASARAAVEQAERKLSDAQASASRLGPAPYGPVGTPCQEGTVVSTNSRAIALRDAAKGARTCNPDVLRQQRAQSAKADVDRAERALESARQRLADLEDEARRGGALPGWVR